MYLRNFKTSVRLKRYLLLLFLLVISITFTGCDGGVNFNGNGTGDLTVVYDYSYFDSELNEEVFFADEIESGTISILLGTTTDQKGFTISDYTAEATFVDLETGIWNITGQLTNSTQEILFDNVSEYNVVADQVNNHTVKVEPEWTVTTDKEVVSAGGQVTIHVRASVNERYYNGVRVTWKLRDPNGKFNKGGSWVTCTEKTISIPSDAQTGEWEIAIYYKDEKVDSVKVTVQ